MNKYKRFWTYQYTDCVNEQIGWTESMNNLNEWPLISILFIHLPHPAVQSYFHLISNLFTPSIQYNNPFEGKLTNMNMTTKMNRLNDDWHHRCTEWNFFLHLFISSEQEWTIRIDMETQKQKGWIRWMNGWIMEQIEHNGPEWKNRLNNRMNSWMNVH